MILGEDTLSCLCWLSLKLFWWCLHQILFFLPHHVDWELWWALLRPGLMICSELSYPVQETYLLFLRVSIMSSSDVTVIEAVSFDLPFWENLFLLKMSNSLYFHLWWMSFYILHLQWVWNPVRTPYIIIFKRLSNWQNPDGRHRQVICRSINIISIG